MTDRLGTIGQQYSDDAGDPLISGKLFVYDSGTLTPKDTYADINLTILNTNPIILDGAGRQPNVWFDGFAKIIMTASDDVQIQERDPIGSSSGGAFSSWTSTIIYGENELVEGSDGNFYRSLSGGNSGNDPTTDTSSWTRVQFTETWNINDTYTIDDLVQGSDGKLYIAITSGNSGNDPVSDAVNWQSASTPFVIGDIVFSADGTQHTQPLFLKCNGDAYSDVTYSALFAKIGGAYTSLPDPSTLPVISGHGNAWSSDDTYLAQGMGGSPFMYIYKRAGDVFTKLSDPSTLPPNQAATFDFSSDDTYLAAGNHSTTPFITIYKRSGDVFTKLTNPSILPASNVNGVKFSPDFTYLACSHLTTPFITIYKRAGDVFTKLTNPSTLPTGTGNACAWDDTGTYLAIAHSTTPFITIYKRAGDVFTKLSDPSVLPASNAFAITFNNDGTKLSVGHSSTPFVTVYNRSGDVFTQVDVLDVLPNGGTVVSAQFNGDSTRFSAISTVAPQLLEYKVDGDNFTLLNERDVVPTSVSTSLGGSYSSTDVYQVTGDGNTPFIHIYKNTAVLPDIQVDGEGLTEAYIKTGL